MDHEEKTNKDWDKLKAKLPSPADQDPPEGYFKAFPEQVLNRWQNEKSAPQPKRIHLLKWITIAAVSIGAVIGCFWWLKQDTTTQHAMYSSSEAYQYVIEHIEEFSPLMEGMAEWPATNEIQLPDSTHIEEYLMDELGSDELEQLF